MMKKWYYNRAIVVLGAAIWGWGGVSGVFASDNSATVLPAEGNVVCADYASNSVILSMDTRSPDESGELTGPENPADADSTGESVFYSITGGTTLSFSDSTTPIDYAVIKSGRDVSVAMYPSGGVTSDGNLTVTVDGEDQVISAFSLCYALGNEAPPPPSATVTKSCDLDAILDATGIQCPTDGSRALVCNFELDDPFFGTIDGSDICCVCNSDSLEECDPGAVAGEPNACPTPKGVIDPTARPTEVTTFIELNNDPYYCITRSGRRFCYPY
jgi:hypothetical protein